MNKQPTTSQQQQAAAHNEVIKSERNKPQQEVSLPPFKLGAIY